jgi:cytochrome c oxidase subunit 2
MNDSRWAILFILAGIVLFVAMPQWRSLARPSEAYPIAVEAFEAKVAEMVAAHGTGREEDGIPVVHPAAGDIYLVARRWAFAPVIELEVGRTYRLHATSADILHGLAIDGREVLLVPGQASVLELKPTRPGRMLLQCSEFCGAEHNGMRRLVQVVPAMNLAK